MFKTGVELLFEAISQRYEQCSLIITSNLPLDEWPEVFGSEKLTGALLDRLTHHVYILEMNKDSYRLSNSKKTERGNYPKYGQINNLGLWAKWYQFTPPHW